MSPYAEVVRLLTDPEHAEWRDANIHRSRVTALEHARQAATRAERSGADDETIIAALVHDAARPLSDVFHGEVIAWIMRGKLREELTDALQHHGTFQTDLVHGTQLARQFRDRSWYPVARRLAAWDAASFDESYISHPLAHFLPRLEAVMAR